MFPEICLYLLVFDVVRVLCVTGFQQKNMIVYVERKVIEDPAIANESFVSVKKNFCTFREGEILSKSIQVLFVCVLQCTDEYIIEYYLIMYCSVNMDS